MDPFSILIAGLIQGIAEWLPISSKTIDAFVFLKFLGGTASQVLPLVLYLHVGTLLAAMAYFRREIIQLIQLAWAGLSGPAPFSPSTPGSPPHSVGHPASLRARLASLSSGPAGFFVAALLATGIVGLPLLAVEKLLLPNLQAGALMVVMGLGLLLTAFLLHTQKGRKTDRTYPQAGWKEGLWCGLLQGLSILPGVSRSGTTTTALFWSNFSPEATFKLSFMLSIPTVFLAEILLWFVQLYQAGGPFLGAFASFPLTDGLLLAAISAVFGYLSIGALLSIARRINFSTAALLLGLMMVAVGILSLG